MVAVSPQDITLQKDKKVALQLENSVLKDKILYVLISSQ